MMQNLVGDEEIWNNLKIDRGKLSNIFASETLDWLKQLLGGSASKGHIAIDTGLLRFPTMENPYVQLHRFRVIALASQGGALGFTSSFNGIVAEISTRKYRFNDESMQEGKKRKIEFDWDEAMKECGIPMEATSEL